LFHLRFDSRPRAGDGQQRNEGGEQDHEDAEAVHGEEVVDVQRVDPVGAVHQLQAGRPGIVAPQHPERDDKGNGRGADGDLLDQAFIFAAERLQQQNDDDADKGEESK
jgi:hypothetical protein